MPSGTSSQPALEQLGRRNAAVGLVGLDGHGRVDRGRDRPRPGPHRQVGVGGAGALPPDPGGQVGDGRAVDEPVEVGHVRGPHARPVEAGQRHDQHAVDRPLPDLLGRRAAPGGQRHGGRHAREEPRPEAPPPHAPTSVVGSAVVVGPGVAAATGWRRLSARRTPRTWSAAEDQPGADEPEARHHHQVGGPARVRIDELIRGPPHRQADGRRHGDDAAEGGRPQRAAGPPGQPHAQHHDTGGVGDRVAEAEHEDAGRAVHRDRADDHDGDAHQRARHRHHAGGAAVAEGVAAARQQQERAVRQQPERQAGHGRGQHLAALTPGVAERHQPHRRLRQGHHARGGGHDEDRHALERPPQRGGDP